MNDPLTETYCVICIEKYNNKKKCRPCKSLFKDTNCNCNYMVHEKCMNEWLLRENKCLICHTIYGLKDEVNNHDCDIVNNHDIDSVVITDIYIYHRSFDCCNTFSSVIYTMVFCSGVFIVFIITYECIKLLH
jgi:hypothetical protein